MKQKQRNVLEQIPIPLLEWYREQARPLPWREERDPYRIWVSETMLQQTRVAAVIGYYHRFLEELPTIQALADCPEERLMKLWQGLGYYRRARNLQKAARMVVEQFDGELPRDFAALRTLPGVGEYTAGAVGSIAFGLPVPAVDGNVLRVVARVTADTGDITSPAIKKQTTQALREILPAACPGDFNQALMELGATVCLPNGAPLCDRCPLGALCMARATERTHELPRRAPRKERRVEERAVYLIEYRGKLALRKRADRGLLAGLWEYPNALASDPDPLAAWGIQAERDEFWKEAKHIFTHVEWRMTARRAAAACDRLPDGWVWADDTARYTIPNAFSYFSLEGEPRWQSSISDTE